jgi:hypothetical protein
MISILVISILAIKFSSEIEKGYERPEAAKVCMAGFNGQQL